MSRLSLAVKAAGEKGFFQIVQRPPIGRDFLGRRKEIGFPAAFKRRGRVNSLKGAAHGEFVAQAIGRLTT